jgi:flagellar M-ring protein FliF
MELERLYRERIEALLTPIAGAGNLSVQVTVDMEFTQSQITEERVDPARSALVSEQSSETNSSAPSARGIPGAVSNTPPVQADPAPQGTPAPQGGTDVAENRSSNLTRNYEVSKTVSTTQPAVARITRISAAILMRAAPPETAPETAPEEGAEPPPLLPPALRADLERLAQTAIGFDAERGDSITIAAQPFVTETVAVTRPVDLSWLPEATRQLALIAGLAIVALGIVRPLLMRLSAHADLPAPQSVAIGAVPGVEVGEGETLDDVQARLDARLARLTNAALGAATTREEKFAVLRQIAAEDPVRIASVIQKMMKADMPTNS